MTKLTECLCRAGGHRNAARNFNKFTNYKPNLATKKIMQFPALRDKIYVKKTDLSRGTSCTEQMIRMLECFKGNEFNEAHCAKEVKAFNECVAEARSIKQAREQVADTDQLGTKGRLNGKQINKLLRMYPNHNYPKTLTHYNGKPMDKPVHPELKYIKRRTEED